jgi:hypothetical protein
LPTASQGGAEDDDEEDGALREPIWRRAETSFDGDVRRWRDEPPSIARRPTREADFDDEPLFASTNPRFLPARISLGNVGRHFKATALVVAAAFVLGLTAVFLFPYALRGLQSRGQPTPTAAPLEADASQQDSAGPVPFASRFGSTDEWPKRSQTTPPAQTTSDDAPVLQSAPAPAPVLQPSPAPAPVLQPAPAAAPVLQPAPAPVVHTATVSAPAVETTTVTEPVVQTETVAPPQSSTATYVAKSEPPPRPALQPAAPEPPPQTQRLAVRGRQALPPQPEPSEGALDPGEVSRLLSRGQAFLNQGDVSAARLALQRVAEAGEPRAALALGATYDPMILKRMGMVGIKPDVEKARSWYERAASLGSAEANQRLNALGQFGR